MHSVRSWIFQPSGHRQEHPEELGPWEMFHHLDQTDSSKHITEQST